MTLNIAAIKTQIIAEQGGQTGRIERPGFRYIGWHPLELSPLYRYHLGSLSVAVWFSRNRDCWVIRNSDLGICAEASPEISAEAMEAGIVDELMPLLTNDDDNVSPAAVGLRKLDY